MSDQQRIFSIRSRRRGRWTISARLCRGSSVFRKFPLDRMTTKFPSRCASGAAGVRVEVPLGRGNRKRVGYCVEVSNASVGVAATQADRSRWSIPSRFFRRRCWS